MEAFFTCFLFSIGDVCLEHILLLASPNDPFDMEERLNFARTLILVFLQRAKNKTRNSLPLVENVANIWCQHFDKWGFYDKCQEITTPFKWVTSLAIVPAGWRPLCYPELKDAVNKWYEGGSRSEMCPINQWDTSRITTMKRLFQNLRNFNEDISNWDVSNVSDMSYMFCNTRTFNQSLNRWNMSNVKDTSFMFANSLKFNQPINAWNVSNVKNMCDMFRGAISFNQPLNNWNVENVTNMNRMFFGTQLFNQSLNNWNVSKVTNMIYIFHNASALTKTPSWYKIKE